MKKTYDLHIRMDENTKKKAQKKAQSLGLDTSSYIRLLINQDIKKSSNKTESGD